MRPGRSVVSAAKHTVLEGDLKAPLDSQLQLEHGLLKLGLAVVHVPAPEWRQASADAPVPSFVDVGEIDEQVPQVPGAIVPQVVAVEVLPEVIPRPGSDDLACFDGVMPSECKGVDPNRFLVQAESLLPGQWALKPPFPPSAGLATEKRQRDVQGMLGYKAYEGIAI